METMNPETVVGPLPKNRPTIGEITKMANIPDTLESMREAILRAMSELGGQRLRSTQIWDQIIEPMTLPEAEFDALSQSFDMALEDLIEDTEIFRHGDGTYSSD